MKHDNICLVTLKLYVISIYHDQYDKNSIIVLCSTLITSENNSIKQRFSSKNCLVYLDKNGRKSLESNFINQVIEAESFYKIEYCIFPLW